MDPCGASGCSDAFAAFVVGACIGSFLNVCVYRIPLDRSVVSPGSHCSACGAPIPWYHNLPVLSWLILRGRAACCGTRIDARYAVVEFGTGLLFLALWLRFPPIDAVIYAIMCSGLIAACLIDLDHFIIPDRFTLGGCMAGFIACAIDPRLMQVKTPLQAFAWSLASAMIGGMLAAGHRLDRHARLQEGGDGHGRREIHRRDLLASSAWSRSLDHRRLLACIGAILGVLLIVVQRGSWGTRIPYGPFLGHGRDPWLFGGST